MGYKELIEAIREEGERRMREIWAEAEARAEEIRREAGLKIDTIRKGYDERFNAEIEKIKGLSIRNAEREASGIRLKAEEDLSRRLFMIAMSLLPILRGEGYDEVFHALVKEIPNSEWVTVRVNPDDTMLARSHFPEAEVIGDPSITGGFVVMNRNGNTIINTFEKRLERLWPEILPEILNAIRETRETSNR